MKGKVKGELKKEKRKMEKYIMMCRKRRRKRS